MSSSPPWSHSPYDVTISGGVRVSREVNIWFTSHVTPCCMLIGPFVPHDLYLALWLVSAQVTPLTTYIPTIISKCCLFQSQHFYQKDLYNVKKGWTNINFLLMFFLLTSFVFLISIRIIPFDGKGKTWLFHGEVGALAGMDSEFGSISASGRGRLSYLLFLFCSKPDFVIVLPCQSLCFSVYTACCHAFLRTINHGPHSSTALCCHCDQLYVCHHLHTWICQLSVQTPFHPLDAAA